MVMLGDEEHEDQEIFLLALDGWSRSRMLRKLMEFEKMVVTLQTAAVPWPVRRVCIDVQALTITLQAWLRQAIPPAGSIEVGENEE